MAKTELQTCDHASAQLEGESVDVGSLSVIAGSQVAPLGKAGSVHVRLAPTSVLPTSTALPRSTVLSAPRRVFKPVQRPWLHELWLRYSCLITALIIIADACRSELPFFVMETVRRRSASAADGAVGGRRDPSDHARRVLGDALCGRRLPSRTPWCMSPELTKQNYLRLSTQRVDYYIHGSGVANAPSL